MTAGLIGGIFLLALSFEWLLENKHYQHKRETFACVSKYLSEKNVSVDHNDDVEIADITLDNCNVTNANVKLDFYQDLVTRLGYINKAYEVNCNECSEVRDVIFTLTAVDTSKQTCNGPEPSNNTEKCENLTECINCFTNQLSERGYEDVRFQLSAASNAVFKFRAWNYLLSGKNKCILTKKFKVLENDSLELCKDKKSCKEEAKLCE